MASEFNGRPFAAGELRGLRDFDVTVEGQLTGCTISYPWTPGENVAVCGRRRAVETVDGSRTVMPFGMRMAIFNGFPHLQAMLSPYTDADTHRAGSLDCACGFYAYTDGESHDYGNPGRITGIIRGYGVCTEGTRGFRAEKAAILALVAPQRTWVWWVTRGIDAGFTGFYIGLIVFGLLRGDYGVALTGVMDVALYFGLRKLLTVLTNRRRRRKHLAPVIDLHRLFRRVRKAYPDVPVYRSLKQALAAHPISNATEVER